MDEAIEAFKEAWHKTDDIGAGADLPRGARTRAGLEAARPLLIKEYRDAFVDVLLLRTPWSINYLAKLLTEVDEKLKQS